MKGCDNTLLDNHHALLTEGKYSNPFEKDKHSLVAIQYQRTKTNNKIAKSKRTK